MKTTKTNATRWLAIILLVVHLVSLTACGKKQPAVANVPSETAMPTETEGHSHEFQDGLCQCGAVNGMKGVNVVTDSGLTAVERLDSETGMTLISSNVAGESAQIRLDKEIETVHGQFYEAIYRFTSNVAGTVYFACDGAVMYEKNTYDVVAGDNEIVVRFAAGGEDGKVAAGLELGELEKFELNFTSISCAALQEDLSAYFLDVAPEKARGNMAQTPGGYLRTVFNTEEGWRVKLAIDRKLEKGKTYETTFVFLRNSGKDQNVTYTVYDGAATVIGSRTKWVDSDLCVATFYLTANETITKGTCLELGMLSGGEEADLTFTYVDFKEVSQEKLAALQSENPFPGVGAWTEGALTPAVATQSAEGLTLVNTNPATDWWKVKLEQDMPAVKDSYYRVTFEFVSDTTGRIKFVNDDAVYYGSNEYDVKKGNNTFTVELKSGGNSYSCLELGGLGPCELRFTDITTKKIGQPENAAAAGSSQSSNRFRNFHVWKDSGMKSLGRSDKETSMTLTSKNEKTDWWKIKLEKDISGKADQWYAVTYEFASDVAGRIKFVNDDAVYYGGNEYDVVVGKNTFTVKFKFGGKPYSCLELGGLGPFKLVFTDYSIKKIDAPEVVSNGFERYQAWTEASMKPLNREDTATSMILTSENAAGDWWKVKLENNFKLQAGKTYEAVYKFKSNASGDIKFGTNENAICHTADIYNVTAGDNQFKVTFTAKDGAYTCLELGGLGNFRLEFTDITLTETEVPEQPSEHTHEFKEGLCSCGANNGFAGVKIWNEGALTPLSREDDASSMTVTSTNGANDWWKVKVEWPLSVTAGKTYEATFNFTSDASGRIKYAVDGATFLDSQEYDVVSGSNTFKVRFTAGTANYSCLELGGLGAFKLKFTGISLKEADAPHTHSFINGRCDCGTTNGFTGVSVWTEGSLTPLVREDTESTMKITSTNGSADWWKMKLEWPLSVTDGKHYEATFSFNSNTSGRIKYSVNAASFHDSQEYDVKSGSNTFKVRFIAGAENYSCLELGGLGSFNLTFTGISLKEIEDPAQPPVHTHSFINGRCDCGVTNGFASVNVWTEGSLAPLTREDDASSMTITSTNGAADWWKVKVERNLNIEEGKTYEVTFRFSSNASGRIKYNVNGAAFLNSNEYDVTSGSNTFTVRFVAGAEKYSCLELGGLGNFKMIFTGISVKEVENTPEPEQPENSDQTEVPEQNLNPDEIGNSDLPENPEQNENPEQTQNSENPDQANNTEQTE